MPSDACTLHAKCGGDHENFFSNRCLQEQLTREMARNLPNCVKDSHGDQKVGKGLGREGSKVGQVTASEKERF